MTIQDKIDAIKSMELSFVDAHFMDLIERTLKSTDYNARVNAEYQVEKWYEQLNGEPEGDYAHCVDCDKLIDLDKDTWVVINDETHCGDCALVAA